MVFIKIKDIRYRKNYLHLQYNLFLKTAVSELINDFVREVNARKYKTKPNFHQAFFNQK